MIIKKNNLQYTGSEGKYSLYDVIYTETDAKQDLVLFCHGFKGFKDWGHWDAIFHKMAEEGKVVVKFNLTHSGIGLVDEQEFTELEAFGNNNYVKELEDLDAIISHIQEDDFLSQIANTRKIHLIGHSRGGSMSILFASRDSRIKSISTWAAVADLQERLPEGEEMERWKREGVRFIKNARTQQNMPMYYQFVESFQKNKKLLSVEKACKKMNIPMLIVHGENDTSVGLEHAYALHVWNPKAQLETILNADHVFNGRHPFKEEKLPFETEELIEITLKFFNKLNG